MDKKTKETRHRTEWCAAAGKYQCMRCGRGSKCMKMQGKCTGAKYLSNNLGKWRVSFGKTHYGKKNGQEEVLIWCRKCSGRARQRMGPKLMNCCKPEQVDTKEHGKMLKHKFRFLKTAGSLPRRQGIGRLKDKKKQGIQANSTGDCGMSLKRRDSWHRKVCGTSPERRCCRTEVQGMEERRRHCKRVQGNA